MAPRSVLDDLGEEITGIVAPVSICMALVVVLVKALNPEGAADTSSVAIATIAYQEKVGARYAVSRRYTTLPHAS